MRTITAAQQKVLDSGFQAEHVRVQVKDAGGTFRDLTTYPGFDAVKSVQWHADIEEPCMTADIELFREQDRLSLAPLITNSGLNLGFVPGGTYAPLLALAREIKIEVAICPMDTPKANVGAGDWFEVFRGQVEEIDPASGSSIRLRAKDLGGRLQRLFIMTERVYSYATVGGTAVTLRVWEPNMTVVAGEYILPASRGTGDPGFDKFYLVATGGTTSTSEPAWTTGAGIASGTAVFDYQSTVTSAGNPVEQIMQSILTDNTPTGETPPTLYTPASPSWNVRQFIQKRETVLEAIRALATQIGWDIRYRWKAASSSFEPTFYEPSRSAPSVAQTFTADDYTEIRRFSQELIPIRNRVTVRYSDRADLWPDGTPKRKPVTVSDSASITAYQLAEMEISEADTSNIDSSTEATTLANNCLSDLKDPSVETEVALSRGFPWVELNDYYSFTGNDRHYTATQSLAVVGFDCQATEGKLRTTLKLRGKPTVGSLTWHRLSAAVNPDEVHATQITSMPRTPSATITETVGGARINLDFAVDKYFLMPEFEHHVYTGAGATLDSSTLVGVSKDRTLEIGDLNPGGTYYHRVVPRAYNEGKIIRGQPSVEQSFVAARGSTGHLTAGAEWGRTPLNGGFETVSSAPKNAYGLPIVSPGDVPDHWTGDTAQIELKQDSNGQSGETYARISAAASAKNIYSAIALGRASTLYRVEVSEQPEGAGADVFRVRLQEMDASLTVITTTTIFTLNSGSVNPWTRDLGFIQTGASTRFLRLKIETDAGTTHFIDFDEVRIVEASPAGILELGTEGTLPTTVTTHYLRPASVGGTADTSEYQVRVPSDGYVKGAYAKSIGGGQHTQHTFTVRKNGSDQSITFTVGTTSGGWTTGGQDATNGFQVAAGDSISIKMVTAIGVTPIASGALSCTLQLFG